MVSPVVAQAILGLKGPDILGSFEAGREQARQEKTRKLAGQAAQGDSQALQELKGLAPELAMKLQQGLGANNAAELNEMVQSASIARRMLEAGQTDGALAFVNQRLELTQRKGGNTAPILRIRDLIASGNTGQALQELKAFDDALGTARQVSVGMQEFDNLTQGLSPEEIERAKRVKLGLAPRAQAPTAAPADVRTLREIQRLRAAGQTREADLLERTMTRATPEEEGAVTRAKEQQKLSQKLAKEAFDKLPGIRRSILNIDQAIGALEKGAETGAVTSYLPSIRSASVELDNLRSQMGLDVIGATTFGALSESELQFALDTALPQKLSPPELRDWLVRKREAQRKVAEALREHARFFSRGGTIDDLLSRDHAPATGGGSPSAAQGGQPQQGGTAPIQIGRFTVEVE